MRLDLLRETGRSFFVAMLVAMMIVSLVACSKPSPQGFFQGYVEGEFVLMASSQPGRLVDLKVKRGQQLAADATLFVLDSDYEDSQLKQAQGQFDSALAQLADMQLGKRPTEVAITAAQLNEAKAINQQKQLEWRRDDTLYRQNAVSQAQWEQSRAAAESSALRVVELTHQVAVAKLPSRIDQIKAQMAAVESARAAVVAAQWRLDQKTVRAPAAALVFDTLYRQGEWVAAGMPVVSLLPPDNIKIRFFVDEPRLGALSIGQPVAIGCDGCNNALSARIDYISPESEFTPPVIYSNETRAKLVYRIEARPESGDALSLHPGQPVTVKPQ